MLRSNFWMSNVPPTHWGSVPSLSPVPLGVATVVLYKWHKKTLASNWAAVFSLRVLLERMSVGPRGKH